MLYIAALAGVFILMYSLLWTKENYGGKVKKIRRIPFNDCARICEGYKRDCLSKYSGTDAGWCHERFGPQGTCVSECYYSYSQRM
jgi:hypothetical protein